MWLVSVRLARSRIVIKNVNENKIAILSAQSSCQQNEKYTTATQNCSQQNEKKNEKYSHKENKNKQEKVSK